MAQASCLWGLRTSRPQFLRLLDATGETPGPHNDMIHILDTLHLGRPGIIAAIALETNDGVALVADRDTTARRPAVGAVLMAQPMREIEFGAILPSGFDFTQNRVAILGMEPLKPLLRRVADLVLFAADKRDPSRGKMNPVRRQIPLPEPLGVTAMAGWLSRQESPNLNRL